MGTGSPVSSSRVSAFSSQGRFELLVSVESAQAHRSYHLPGNAVSSALEDMRRRLEFLESENARSEAKVVELQDRLAGRNALSGKQADTHKTNDPNSMYAPCLAGQSL